MRKYSLSILLCLLFLLLLLFPDIAKSGASDGLFLWYNSIVPILFPFIILSNMMVTTGSFSWFLQPFFLLQKKFPSFHPWYFYALILGFFCGYPMGAKAVADLIDQGKLSISEGNSLIPIVNQASPMFLAGYVGVHIFKRSLPLSRILFFIYCPALVSFLFLLFHKNRAPGANENVGIFTCLVPSHKKNSMSLSMEHTIWDSFFILVTIGVYMMLFSILMKLSHALLPHSLLLTIGTCFLEFSTGLHTLNEMQFLSYSIKTSLLLALTSFGGFCTAAQTYSITHHSGISMKSYLIRKAFLALLVFLLSYSSLSSS